jgi:hypothetical protein
MYQWQTRSDRRNKNVFGENRLHAPTVTEEHFGYPPWREVRANKRFCSWKNLILDLEERLRSFLTLEFIRSLL